MKRIGSKRRWTFLLTVSRIRWSSSVRMSKEADGSTATYWPPMVEKSGVYMKERSERRQ